MTINRLENNIAAQGFERHAVPNFWADATPQGNDGGRVLTAIDRINRPDHAAASRTPASRLTAQSLDDKDSPP